MGEEEDVLDREMIEQARSQEQIEQIGEIATPSPPPPDSVEVPNVSSPPKMGDIDEIKCDQQCLVRIPVVDAQSPVKEALDKLKQHFYDQRNTPGAHKLHQLVKEIEGYVAASTATAFAYKICPYASKCLLSLSDLKTHREILRAFISMDMPETLSDNRLVRMLDYVEGLRSTTLVSNIDPTANVQFTNRIELIRRRIYNLYQQYGTSDRSPRNERLFWEGAREIELAVNTIMGHIVAAGMKRREELHKWEIVARDSRRYLAAAVAHGAQVSPMASGDPPAFASVAAADPTFAKMDITKFSEMQRQQMKARELRVEQQVNQIKDTEKVRDRVRAMRGDG